MMLAQMKNIIVDMFVLLVGLQAVRGRSRVGDSFVNSVVITMHMIMAKINMVPMMMSMVESMMMMRVVEMVSVMMTVMISMMMTVEVAIMMSMMVTMVVSMMSMVDDIVLLCNFISVSSNVHSSHGHNFRRAIIGGDSIPWSYGSRCY